MRTPSRLSHSSQSLYHKDTDEFYLKYLSDHRPPRKPQANYMAIGSAFDAYVKSALNEALFGVNANEQFDFTTIFEEQVEPHNRDWGLEHGKYVFDCYVATGAYDDLLELLKQSREDPQFEFTVQGEFEGKELTVPFMGKPDCYFIHENGFPVMLDWKVRGYCSKYSQSPTKFFTMCRDSWNAETAKPTRGGNRPHKLYLPIDHEGLEIHAGWMEDGSKDYADQLSAYTWLMGGEIGKVFLGCIDEIVCKPTGGQPLLRVAQHRSRVSTQHQFGLLDRIEACWKACTTGHIYPTMTVEENRLKCEALDRTALGLSQNDEHADYYNEICRAGYC